MVNSHRTKGIVNIPKTVVIKTIEATKEESLLYFAVRIIVITADGIAASIKIMFFTSPVIENILIIKNATKNPPIILNKEARNAVFADFIFIPVSW